VSSVRVGLRASPPRSIGVLPRSTSSTDPSVPPRGWRGRGSASCERAGPNGAAARNSREAGERSSTSGASCAQSGTTRAGTKCWSSSMGSSERRSRREPSSVAFGATVASSLFLGRAPAGRDSGSPASTLCRWSSATWSRARTRSRSPFTGSWGRTSSRSVGSCGSLVTTRARRLPLRSRTMDQPTGEQVTGFASTTPAR